MKFQHIAVRVADKEESCAAKLNSLRYFNPHSALQAVVFPSTKKISPLTYQKSDLRVGWDNCSLTWIENNTQNQSLMSLNSNY